MTTRKTTKATRNPVAAEAAAPAEAAGAAEAKAGQARPSRRDQVVALASEGTKTAAEIAKATGLTVAGVRHHLKAAGLTAARPEREQRVSPHRAEVGLVVARARRPARSPRPPGSVWRGSGTTSARWAWPPPAPAARSARTAPRCRRWLTR